MKKLAFEWKVLIFGKLAVIPFLVGITWFLVHEYTEFIHARNDLSRAQELHQLSQLYREIVQERGTAMLFLRGRTSIYEFKDVVKRSEDVEKKLTLLSKNSESLIASNMVVVRSLRDEIFTQGLTPDQAFANYQNVLTQILQVLSVTKESLESIVASTANLLFEDVASLRDLLIQQAIVNMPLSSQDFNLLLEKATRPSLHENILSGNGHGPVWAALQGWQDLAGQKAIKKKLDLMIKTADQGNYKISPEEIYTDSTPVLKKLDDVAKVAFGIFLDKLKDEEKSRRLNFVYYFFGVFLSTTLLGFSMRHVYRHTIFHHKQHLWEERKRFAELSGASHFNISTDQGRYLGEKITALQMYPLRYKAAYYNKSVDQENGQKELESINFDFSTDLESLILAVKSSEVKPEVQRTSQKTYTRPTQKIEHGVSPEQKKVVNS